MLAIQHRAASPRPARLVQPLDFAGHPVRFLFRRCKFRDADFFSRGIVGDQRLVRQKRGPLIVLNDFTG